MPIVWPQTLPNVDGAGSKQFAALDRANLIDATMQDVVDCMNPGHVIPIRFDRSKVDNPAVILSGDETDGRQCPNDTILGAAQPFEIDIVLRSELPSFALRHQLALATKSPIDHNWRHRFGNAQTRIASSRAPTNNDRSQLLR